MKIKPSHRARVLGLTTLIILISPVIFYVLTFGGEISTSHARWAEMGTFFGGIYTPITAIVTIFTLLVLVVQVKSQLEFNKHSFDHAYLSNARSQLHFYIEQLDNALKKHESISNTPLSHALITMFGSRTHEQLRSDISKVNYRRIGMTDTRISGLWGGIYTIFAGLKNQDEEHYALEFSSAKYRCIAIFGYDVCDALDNYHYVACDYPDEHSFEFHRPPEPA